MTGPIPVVGRPPHSWVYGMDGRAPRQGQLTVGF